MAPGPKSNRVKPSEVAADTKRNFIPIINASYSELFPPYSILYRQPTTQLEIRRRTLGTRPPLFRVEAGDPVTMAISFALADSQASEAMGGPRIRIPFICAANERRPGGDWETGCSGYEEKLCRRSNLSATLGTPWASTRLSTNYPIPSAGGILSDAVVVCRGPHEHYQKLETWHDLPVVSVPPTRWPKLKDNGTRYSFTEERHMMREKIRGALRICLYNNYDRVVIGDFGLGNSYRNPPQEVAELWRDVLLFDPDLRGQFSYVVFAFDEPAQSTTQLIWDQMAKKDRRGSSSRSAPQADSSKSRSTDQSRSSSSSSNAPTDITVFHVAFDPLEIDRVLSAPDPRYGLDMITI